MQRGTKRIRNQQTQPKIPFDAAVLVMEYKFRVVVIGPLKERIHQVSSKLFFVGDADVVQCDASEFKCKYPVCVLKEYQCDGDNDCGDWSDEEDCPRRTACVHGDFQCRSGTCLPGRQRCNGERDCEDGEDEADCGPELPATCPPGQHACSSGYCIEAAWVCDGTEDCPGGEDEVQCEPPACNNQTHYACSDEPVAAASTPPPSAGVVYPHPLDMAAAASGFSCIPKKHVCDGKKDCGAGDDERDCPVPRNCSAGSGCAQLCMEAAGAREVCSCRPGYRLAADGRGCEDVDECADDEDPPCQQGCTNTNGSFLCSCRPDYVMRPDRRSCKSVEAPATLLLTNRVDIRQVNLNNRRTHTVLRGLHNAVALDFHWRTGEVYWSDYSMHVIRKAALNGSVEQDVVRWGLQTPAGLAVDWVHGLLFWTDYELRRVDVANLDGSMPTTIAHTDLEKPRDVAVHPGRAFVFWTDWGPRPKIERVEMNGQNRRAIITQGIKWPNGLALDYDNDRIFWTDAMYHVIESSDLDGRARSVVLAKGLPHPFALTLFEDTVYWTDWHTRSVMGANKVTGRRVHVVLDRLHLPMQVHSCHPKRQLTYTDRCPRGNDSCSHLCLPSATSFTCVCPVGVRLQSNRRSCEASPESMLVYVRKKEIHLREMSGSAAETGALAALGLGSSARDVVLAVDGVRHAQAVAWDSASDSIFWSDFKATTISRARRDGSQQRVVVGSDLEDPVGLAVDWVRRRLYFSDYKSQRIETTDLEGEERVVLLWDLSGPRHLALFPPGGVMFWSSWGGPKPLIESAGMDGRRRRAFISDRLISPGALAIDHDRKRLYWTDPGLGVIDSINVDGTDRRLVMDKMAHPLGLDVFGNRLYWTDSKNNDLYVLKDGKHNHTVRAGVSGLLGVTVFHQRRQPVRTGCDQPGPYLLLARRWDVRRVPLGLPYVMDVPLPTPGLQLQNTVAVDADRATGDVYWSDTIISAIMRATRTGENATVVISSGLDTPYGLAVDSVGRKVYWTDSGRRIIEVAELDGARRRVLVWDKLHNPCALTLHYPSGLMFWSDWEEHSGRIERANMDGSARVVILSDEVGWPGGLAVHDDRLYWSDVALHTVESARLDGSERALVLHRLREDPAGVAILGGQVYWGYRGVTGALHRAPLPKNPPVNASEDSVIRPGLPYLLDIKAIDTSPLPENACLGASCSDLCLRVPGGRACACPTGVPMGRDGRTCSTNVTEMLLFATPDGLARIATSSLQRFHDVLLPVPDVRKVVAVDFHWEHKLVVFADMSLQEIRRVVGVARLDGRNQKILVSKELSSPRAVVVHPKKGLMFWTDWGPNGTSDGTKIERAQLDGSERRAIVSTDLDKPNGLALDVQGSRLYWANYGRARIESCEITGNDRIQLVAQAQNVFGLTTVGDHIFWTDFSKRTLERASKRTGRDRMTVETMVDQVEDLKAVSSARQRRAGTPPCGDDNGGCSHLCLAREVDIVCACPDQPHGPCKRAVNRRAPNPSEEGEYDEIEEGLTDVSHIAPDLRNATTKTAP
ncbi:low-density lipoprotein receptor, partial [Frankliniella occidentalis]